MKFYSDVYLKKMVTEEIELRADEHVASLGTFTEEWKEKLSVIRAYIIVCIENVKNEGDIFTAKLKMYKSEFNDSLRQAKTDSAAATGSVFNLYSIELYRS